MTDPRTTGLVARLLGTHEPKLNGLIRRGLIDPEPPIASGRRLWSPAHIRQAARILDIHDIDRVLAGEVER